MHPVCCAILARITLARLPELPFRGIAMRLAAVLIVKNEAEHLEACLHTLTWVDELVVLDAGTVAQ